MLNKVSRRNRISLIITFVSYLFVVPGILLPALSLKSHGKVESAIGHAHAKLMDTSNSIWYIIEKLFNNDQKGVAFTILLFAIIIPILKGILLISAYFSRSKQIHNEIFKFINI